MPPHGPAHNGTRTYEAGPDGRLDWKAQVQANQRVQREWARHLPASEMKLLGAILDRTVAFQYATRKVYIAQLAELAGCTERWVYKHLARLRERGVVSTMNAGGRGLNVTVNLDWEPTTMAVPVPKRLKAGVNERAGETCTSVQGCPERPFTLIKRTSELDFGHLQKKTVAKQGLNASSPLPLNH